MSKRNKSILCFLLAALFIFLEVSPAVLAYGNNTTNGNNITESKNIDVEKDENKIKNIKSDVKDNDVKDTTIKDTTIKNIINLKNTNSVKEEKNSRNFAEKQLESIKEKILEGLKIETTTENKETPLEIVNSNEEVVENDLNAGNSGLDDPVVLDPNNSSIEEPKKLTYEEYSELKKDSFEETSIRKDEVSGSKTEQETRLTSGIEEKTKAISDLIDPGIETRSTRNNSVKMYSNNEDDGLELSDETISDPVGASGTAEIRLNWIQNNKEISETNINQDWKNGSKNIQGRINYSISSEEDFKPGEVEITIPKYLYKDRNGKNIGGITLGVPRFPSSRQPMAYIEKEDSITIVNTRILPKTITAFVEFTYTSVSPWEVKDGEVSNNISANLKINHNDYNTNINSNNTLTTVVDTEAKITGVSANEGYPYEVYPDIFPSDLKPSDDGNYVYADYTFDMNYKATQKYASKFVANATSYNGKILGIRNSSDNELIKGNGTGSLTVDIKRRKYGTDLNRENFMTVYVAYPVSQFKENKTYNLSINGKYTVTSEDDKEVTSKNINSTVPYTPIRFSAPDNHFGIVKNGYGKNRKWTGLKYEGNYPYALNQLQMDKSVDIEYDTYVQAFTLPFTYPGFKPNEENKSDNLDDYKQRVFTTEVKDGNVETKYNNINYEIKSLKLENFTLYDYLKYDSSSYGYLEDPTTGKVRYGFIPIGQFGYKSKNNVSDLGIKNKEYTFQILASKDEKNYTPYANVKIDSGITLEALNGASVDGNRVTFPGGMKDYKILLKSGFPGYTYTIKPTITIKADENSNKVATSALTKDIPLEKIKTTGDMIGITDDNQTLLSAPDYANDNLMGVVNGVRLVKDMNYSNDVNNARVILNYTLKMQNQTNQVDLKDISEASKLGILKEETGATWYALLPRGLDININTITTRPGDTILDREIKKNWKNTGRDLLVVKLKQNPKYEFRFSDYGDNFIGLDGYADEPRISFSGKYSWVMMNANSVKRADGGVDCNTNIDAVYKSDNENIGTLKGYKGETSSSETNNRYTPKLKDYMKDISGVDGNNSYLYWSSVDKIDVDKAALVGVSKLVDVNNEKDYTAGTSYDENKKVYENGYYSYRIMTTTDDKSEASNWVIYDKLDGYELIKDVDSEHGSKQFKGTFRGLDLSMAESLGIKPVVYYSTNPNIDIGKDVNTPDMDLTSKYKIENVETNNWTTTKPEDSKITAIAIDLSKKVDGSDFILGKNQSMMVEVLMKAPSIKAAGENSFAFNKSTITFKEALKVDDKLEAKTTLKTKIGIKPFNIDIQASWDDDNDRDGKRPEDIKVQLVKNGKPVGNTVPLNELNKLYGKFENAEYQDENGNVNSYSIKVVDGSKDYKYVITGPSKIDDGIRFNLVAKHEPERITIEGEKIWEGKKIGPMKKYDESYLNRPSSINIDLYKNDKKYKTIKVVPDKDNNWNFEVPNEYKYENKGQEIKYRFVENNYIKGYIPAEYSEDGLKVINKYYPFGDLKLTKELIYATSKAKEQSFDFEVKIENLGEKGEYTLDTRTYKYETDSGNKGTISTGGIINMKPGKEGAPEIVTIKDLPTESKVTITEQDKNGFKASKRIQSTDIKSGRESELHFENTYSTKGKVFLKANKAVTGRKLDGFLFLFDLKDSKGNIIQSVRNSSDGLIYFEPIEYTLDDVDKATSKGNFEYTIVERNDSRPGYSYDSKEYKVIVSLQDNGDGTITATPQYKLNGKLVDKAEFGNEYKATGDLNITSYKALKYTTLKPEEGTIKYTLYDKENPNVEIGTGTNDSQGKVSINVPKKFTEKDAGKSFEYWIKETKSDPKLFQKNNDILKFKVTVKDNGDGTLSTTQEYLGRYDSKQNRLDPEDNTIPQLENTGNNSNISVEKKVTGDYKDPNKLFKFKVKFTGDKNNIPKELSVKRLPVTIESTGGTLNAIMNKSEETGNSLIREATLMTYNELGDSNELEISDLIKNAQVTADQPTENIIMENEDEGYTVKEDTTDENSIILDVQNSYADGLKARFFSNNGETRSFKKEYKPKELLGEKDVFPGNQNNWGNPGLVIKGWSTDSKATEPMYKVNQPIKDTDIYTKRSTEEATKNQVDLYAVWGKPGFNITFNSNGGSGSMAGQTVEYDVATALNTNTFYQLGKRFIGWSTTSNGQVEYNDKAEITKSEKQVVNEKLILYAVWEDDNLNLKSDTGEFKFTLRDGEKAILENLPAYLNYEVTELPDPAWGLVASENTKGITNPLGNPDASFTNEYGAKSVQYVVNGIKKINGIPSSLDDFSFKLVDKQTNKEFITKADNNTGVFEFEPLLFTKPGQYKFTVTEVESSNPNYNTDKKEFDLTLTVVENEGKLEVSSDVSNIEFNNTSKESKIIITKTTEGEWLEENKSFRFKPVINGVDGEEFTLSNGQSKEIPVKYGDKYDIKELDTGTWKTISENTTGTIDKDVINVKFNNISLLDVNDDTTGPTTDIEFKKQLIGRDMTENEFKFDITFKDINGNIVRNITSGNGSNGLVNEQITNLVFKKSKTVEIKEIAGSDNSIEYDTTTYIYNISNADGKYKITNNEGKDLKDLVITNKVKPGKLNVTLNILNPTEKIKDTKIPVKVKIGEEIKEYEFISGQKQTIVIPAGVEYKVYTDKLPNGFTLKDISNDTGTMIPNGDIDSIINIEYNASIGNTIKATKKMLDENNKESSELLSKYQFNYILLDENNKIISRSKNDSDGNIVFPEILYGIRDIGKTYKYTIAELDDGQFGIIFDKSKYKVEIKIEDSGNGLTVSEKITKEGITDKNGKSEEVEPVFTNKYSFPVNAPLTGYSKTIIVISALTGLVLAGTLLLRRRKSIEKL